MGRADIGKDIARASLCLHLNNKTLHVRPAVTPPRQRALTRFHGRGPNSQPLPFLPRASPLSKRLSRYGNRDGTRAFLRGTSWERRFLRAEPRYTRQSFLETSNSFSNPPTWNFKFYFFFYLSKGRKILPRIFKQLSHILLLLLSINKAKRDERSLNERDLRSMRV